MASVSLQGVFSSMTQDKFGRDLPDGVTEPSNVVPIDPLGRRKVTLMKDSTLEFPELWMDVYVAGPRSDAAGFAEMFTQARCTKANTPSEADLIVFTGGADVDPQLYGETQHSRTYIDSDRDRQEIDLYNYAFTNGIPMFGVCRGAQFLHVMNGGKLYQDIDNHNGDHNMYDIKTKTLIQKVSSVHHQAVVHNDRMEVLGDTMKSSKRWYNNTTFVEGTTGDIEAYWYPDTMCFGVQGHPEYANYHQFRQWCLDKLFDLVVMNTDTEMVAGKGGRKFRRATIDFITARNQRILEEDDEKKLLSLLGAPVLNAPTAAEISVPKTRKAR